MAHPLLHADAGSDSAAAPQSAAMNSRRLMLPKRVHRIGRAQFLKGADVRFGSKRTSRRQLIPLRTPIVKEPAYQKLE